MKRTDKPKQSHSPNSNQPPRKVTPRKRSPQKSQPSPHARGDSEKRFSALIENSTDGVALLGVDGTVLYVSPSTERIFGYTDVEMVGIPGDTFIHPDDRESMTTKFAKLLEKPEEDVRAQYRFRHKDGSWRLLKVVARNLLREPSVRAIVFNYRDTSERKRAEQARQAAEEKYHSIFDNAVEGMFQSTPEGRFATVNPALARMWGYASPEELIASITDIAQQIYFDPIRRAEFRRLLEEQDEVQGFEFQVRRKDGSVMWVSENARAVRDAQGTLLYYEGTTEDITARKRAEESLQESEERFSSAFEHAAIGMALVAPDGHWLKVNRALCELTGYSESELLSKTFQDITHPDDLDADLAYVRQMLAGEIHTYQMEKRYFHKSGQVVWVLLSVSLVWGAQGKPLHFIAQIQDVTERRRAEQELQRRADELAALYDTTLDLATEQDLPALLQTVVDRATLLLNAPGAFFYLYDPVQRNLELKLIKGISVPLGTRLELGEGMAGRVAQSHQPLIVDDYHTWEHRARTYNSSPFTAVVEVPMLYRGELIGVLGVQEMEDATRKFTDADARLLTLFAGQAASAVHNARLFEETRQRAQRQEALYRISTSIASSHGALELCERVVRACREVLGYSYLGIFLLEPETGDRVLQAQSGWEDAPMFWRLHPGEGFSEQTLLTGELHYCPDVSREPRYVQGLRTAQSEVDVPIKIGDSVLGVMTVENDRIDAFNQGDFDVLQAAANQLAVALDNTRLFDETHQRLAEMEAVNKISTALRVAQTLDDILPLLLDETISAVDSMAASIWLYDPVQGKLHQVAEHGFPYIGMPLESSQGIAGHVFTTGRIYLSREFKTDPLTAESARAQVPEGLGGACIPIRAADQVIGAFFVSIKLPRQLTSAEIHLLTTVAEIAGNAIHRTRLHEQTKQQLQRLDALHTIDKTITSSLDLRVTLGVLLNQITSQLGVDAARVLLLNPNTQTLEFSAGRGFRTRGFERSSVHLGESIAGRAVLERRAISIPDFATRISEYSKSATLAPHASPDVSGMSADARDLQSEMFVTYYSVPLISKGQVKGVLEVFHRAPLVTGEHWLPFLETLAEQTAIAIDSIGLFNDLQRSNMELSLAYDTTLEGWSRALDLRDRETEGHTQRTVELTLRLAREMGISESELVHIRRGVLLHDIGKMGISDSILLKPGPLTPEEVTSMRRHPEYALEMLAPIQYLERALDVPYCHHEKWDGTGYPRGLKGEQIPLAARNFAIVDVWDALLSDRPYRAAWQRDQVCAYIREQSGSHFDPEVVAAFFKIIGD